MSDYDTGRSVDEAAYDAARMAVDNLKEPTPHMIRAGMCVLEETRGVKYVRRADMELVEAIWRAMVEEALK